ncbi:flagellin N-terminal helical domain-containing protein [Priestia aryabhattai]
MFIKTDIANSKLTYQQELSSKSTSQSIEKLSTGLRINSISEDIASLSMGNRLKGYLNTTKKGIENVQYSIDLLNTMESGASTITNIIQRLRELAIQNNNSTLSTSDKASIQPITLQH